MVEWVAHFTKVIGSIPEGDQKGHKYTCFARSALFTGNLYDLYALVLLVYDEGLFKLNSESPRSSELGVWSK